MDEPLTYKGVQVPWVTRWSSEVREDGYELDIKEGVFYKDEREEDRVLGVLWMRQNNSPGEGIPEFAQVQTYRQRDSMLGPCCQVCGRIIEGKLTWLMPTWMFRAETRGKNRFRTATPPTCETCIPVARELCPHLNSNDNLVLDVRGYRHWGVFGDLTLPHRGQVLRQQSEIPFLDENIRFVLGRQLVTEIFSYTKRKESDERNQES